MADDSGAEGDFALDEEDQAFLEGDNCPEIIEIYNKCMRGVDLMDRMETTYQYGRDSKSRIYLSLFLFHRYCSEHCLLCLR